MKQHHIAFILLFLLAGCANNNVWYKPGASTNEFNVDKYDCLQQSQQQSSTAVVGQHVGFASNGWVTNWNLFNSCMNAKGWSLQDSEALQKTTGQNSAASTDEKPDRPKHYASKSLEELKSNWSEKEKYAFDLGIAARLGYFVSRAEAVSYGEKKEQLTADDFFILYTDSDFLNRYKDSPGKLLGLRQLFEILREPSKFESLSESSKAELKAELPDVFKDIITEMKSTGPILFPLALGEAYQGGFVNALMDKTSMTPRSERGTGEPFFRYINDTIALEYLHQAFELGYLHGQKRQSFLKSVK